MVNFKNRLAGKKAEKPTDPVELYETLDRASDKGPLRPAQLAVLNEWFSSYKNSKDTIVKLHTGQGKTLIGLLMLQAQLNAGKGPALYLCPDNFLIAQTCEQAKQFGIATCRPKPNSRVTKGHFVRNLVNHCKVQLSRNLGVSRRSKSD